MEAGTESLRKAAPDWTLAGDKQLLDILQNIHQSLVSRCQEVHRKLDEMVTVLDGASVDLQNVNNKFMALSNSQFVESRVYDDDVEVTAQEQTKESPVPPTQSSDIDRLKHSIRVLEGHHEIIEIMDSDSDDSDDDDVSRMVLKPKDMYAHRPLPYIIGSQQWRNKWHAGLHREDSDSESVVSEPDIEPENSYYTEPVVSRTDGNRDIEVSTGSSELPSEQDVGVGSLPTAGVKPSPSDVAAELARRLGGHTVKIPPIERDFSAPNPSKMIYKPEQPTVGAIFFDEPPPIDQCQSDDTADDDDIFAELHKSRPYEYNSKDQSRLADDLFGGFGNEIMGDDIFNDAGNSKSASTSVAKTRVLEDESEPELFVDISKGVKETRTPTEGLKKPIGGISLFGNNGAESIGAAILKRNQRKSSSDDESEEPTVTKAKNKEKNILDDLFSKTEKQKVNEIKPKVDSNKVDLFSDDLFDDVDDIFTSITVSKKESDQKPLFGDDDDIFADVAVKSVGTKNNDKHHVVSDDELFKEKETSQPIKGNTDLINKIKSESIFDNNDGEIDIFSNITSNENSAKTNSSVDVSRPKHLDLNKNIDSINKETESVKTFSAIDDSSTNKFNNDGRKNIKEDSATKSATKSLFDDDDDDELFKTDVKMPKSGIVKESPKADKNEKSSVTKTALFDDDGDDDDDLFGFSSKKNIDVTKSPENKSIIMNKSINTKSSSIFNDDDDDENDDIFAKGKDTTLEGNSEMGKTNTGISTITAQKDSIVKNNDKIKSYKESIFDDDDDDDDDSMLFAKVEKKPVVDKSKPVFEPIAKEEKPLSDNQKAEKTLAKDVNDKDIISEIEVTKEVITNEHHKDIKEETGTGKVIKDTTAKETVEKENSKAEVKIASNEVMTHTIEENKNITLDKNTEPTFKDTKEPIQTNSDIDFNSKIPDFETKPKDTLKPQDNEINTLFANAKEPLFQSPSVFDDIFSEPPDFQKSEPKKCRNVNALFDDDSDDETFFKKNDATTDEKPNLDVDRNDALFGIFQDEPPEIDVDFTQKSSKVLTDDFLDEADNIFVKKQENEIVDFEKNEPKESSSVIKDIGKDTKDLDIKQDKSQDDKSEKTHQRIEKESAKVTTDFTEIKKVGKLKSMNFNIDVNTLLPGASPKKKAVEQTDGKAISTQSQEDLHSNEIIEKPEMMKSVSFDGNPDSKVLDNKLSKERAKIQVKRRPSTRRARKEAVRISAIDFGDDSTDNSSSIDDAPKSNKLDSQSEDITNLDKAKSDQIIEKKIDSLKSQTENIPQVTKQSGIKINEDLFLESSKEESKKKEEIKEKIADSITTTNDSTKRENKVTSKIVYILNDEDIFTNPSIEEAKPDNFDENLYNNLDNSNIGVKTLGKTYKDNRTEVSTTSQEISKSMLGSHDIENDTRKKKSIFDDLSDDNNLFNKNKKVTSKTKGLFDSDSEDELFGRKSETKDKLKVEKQTKDRQVPVKSSLFGDDDDDDLFGVKVKSSVTNPKPSTSTREVNTEPVFQDPLSMLGDEEF